MGGKGRSVNKILSILPAHKTYIEPFFGGGALFFAKEKVKIEILNDINKDLINFYEVLRTQYDDFIHRFDYVLRSKEQFLECRKTMSDNSLSPLERAFRFYYVNQNSFGGLIRYNKSGGCNSPFGANSDYKHTICNMWDFDKLEIAHDRIKNAFIECDNYQNIIKKYDRDYVLFFLDPPYDCKSGKYNGEINFDYDELLNQCRNIKGKFILTLNSGLENKFKEFYIIPNDVHYSIGCTSESSKSYKEIIVTNYNI